MAKLKMAGRNLKPAGNRVNRSVNPSSWRGSKSSAQRGYGYKWQKERLEFLSEHPTCVYCESAGIVSAGTVVDHIVPHRGNTELFWDKHNWQTLCATCHSSLKQKEEASRRI